MSIPNPLLSLGGFNQSQLGGYGQLGQSPLGGFDQFNQSQLGGYGQNPLSYIPGTVPGNFSPYQNSQSGQSRYVVDPGPNGFGNYGCPPTSQWNNYCPPIQQPYCPPQTNTFCDPRFSTQNQGYCDNGYSNFGQSNQGYSSFGLGGQDCFGSGKGGFGGLGDMIKQSVLGMIQNKICASIPPQQPGFNGYGSDFNSSLFSGSNGVFS